VSRKIYRDRDTAARTCLSRSQHSGLLVSTRKIAPFFAVNARIISCLVTESLLRALYIPIHGFEATGICVILNNGVSSKPPSQQPCTSKDIVAVVPLRHLPIFRHDSTDTRRREIGLLEPLDMLPLVFEVDTNDLGVREAEVCPVHFSRLPLLKFVRS